MSFKHVKRGTTVFRSMMNVGVRKPWEEGDRKKMIQ